MTIEIVEGDLPDAWLQAAMRARIVGADIETSGLERTKDRIACIQIYVPGAGTVMVRNLESPAKVLELLQSWRVTKIFQFADFDLSFLLRDYPILVTYPPKQIVDTKIAAGILDPDVRNPEKAMFIDPDTGKGSHSLKILVYHYFGYKMDKSIAVSNWFAQNLTQAQLDYAAKDVEYLPPLLKCLESDITNKAVTSGDFSILSDLYYAYQCIVPNVIRGLKIAA